MHYMIRYPAVLYIHSKGLQQAESSFLIHAITSYSFFKGIQI